MEHTESFDERRARELAEARALMLPLSTKIVELLGLGWVLGPRPEYDQWTTAEFRYTPKYHGRTDDGILARCELLMKRQQAGRKTFLTFSGGAVWDKEGNLCGPKDCTINVSDTKSPEQIVADVKRRLLDGYFAKFDEAVELARAHNIRSDEQWANVTELAEMLNEPIKNRHESDKRPAFVGYTKRNGQIDNRVDVHVSGDSVRLTIDCKMAQARRVIAALRDENDAQS